EVDEPVHRCHGDGRRGPSVRGGRGAAAVERGLAAELAAGAGTGRGVDAAGAAAVVGGCRRRCHDLAGGAVDGRRRPRDRRGRGRHPRLRPLRAPRGGYRGRCRGPRAVPPCGRRGTAGRRPLRDRRPADLPRRAPRGRLPLTSPVWGYLSVKPMRALTAPSTSSMLVPPCPSIASESSVGSAWLMRVVAARPFTLTAPPSAVTWMKSLPAVPFTWTVSAA